MTTHCDPMSCENDNCHELHCEHEGCTRHVDREGPCSECAVGDEECEHRSGPGPDGQCQDCGVSCSLAAEQDDVCYDAECPLHGGEVES